MNIGIDIDDTISETYATLLEYAQKYTIEEIKRSPIIKSFNTEDHLYIENMHNWNENETARYEMSIAALENFHPHQNTAAVLSGRLPDYPVSQ